MKNKKSLIRKVLFLGTFLFCGCSVGVLTLKQEVAKYQLEKWKSFTIRGTAKIWQDGKQIEQKIYINKDKGFSIVCYGGGVFGVNPVPSLVIEANGDTISYKDKTMSAKRNLDSATDKPLYAVLYAMSRLDEVYTTQTTKIGNAKIKVDELGNPIQIASGSLKVVMSYEKSELQKLEIYFGLKKILETIEIARE